jgi:hypothetical protein
VNETTQKARGSLPLVLRGSAVVELATGMALLVAPSGVLGVLIGSPSDSATALVARVLGGALFGLGVAGWLAGPPISMDGITLAFVLYNVLTTAILAIGGLAGTADGSLLWPVVALHAVAAGALIAGSVRTREPRC